MKIWANYSVCLSTQPKGVAYDAEVGWSQNQEKKKVAINEITKNEKWAITTRNVQSGVTRESNVGNLQRRTHYWFFIIVDQSDIHNRIIQYITPPLTRLQQ